LASNRSEILNTLKLYDRNSIAAIKNTNAAELPFGKKILKNCIPHCLIPSRITPNQTVNPNPNVIAKWLVTVKLYGINPTKLHINMNRNKKNMNGKNNPVFFPTYV